MIREYPNGDSAEVKGLTVTVKLGEESMSKIREAALDEIDAMRTENAKLRKMVQDLKRHVCKLHRDEPCAAVCDAYDSGLGRCVYEAKMRELGVTDD